MEGTGGQQAQHGPGGGGFIDLKTVPLERTGGNFCITRNSHREEGRQARSTGRRSQSEGWTCGAVDGASEE